MGISLASVKKIQAADLRKLRVELEARGVTAELVREWLNPPARQYARARSSTTALPLPGFEDGEDDFGDE